jgi:cytochrome c biogenesis protein CcmG, thiol:disulfide interchange protein DsbE
VTAGRRFAGATGALLAAVTLAGCAAGAGSVGSAGSAGSLPRITADPALVARAALAPCPSTSAGPTNPPAGQSTGRRLPGLRLPCLGSAASVDLAALRGPAIVNLWWSGCAPCREESPLLQRLHAAAAGRVRVVGIDVEEPDAGLRFAIAEGLHYPMLSDPHESVKDAGLLPGYPITYFVAADGERVAAHPGAYASAAALRADVRRYLGVDVP